MNRADRRRMLFRSRGLGPRRVRNVGTGRVLPCCYGECARDGDDRHQLRVLNATGHVQPCHCARCRLQVGGDGSIYIFCSPEHRELYASEHRKSLRANESGS